MEQPLSWSERMTEQMQKAGDKQYTRIDPPLRVVTLGMFLLLYKDHQEWKPLRSAELTARGSSLTLMKLLVSSSPSVESAKRAREWEWHEGSKDQVIDALWPEAKMLPADPDNAVSVAKSALNRALRPYTQEDVVLLTDGTDKVGYRLNTQVVAIDVDEFEHFVSLASEAEGRKDKGAAQQFWEKAHQLVQGEFLPHDRYNDWAHKRRERLHSKYTLLLHCLSRLYAEQGRTTEAVELLHPHVLVSPTDFDALCVLLPLLVQQGRFEEARKMLEIYREEIKEEGKEPPLKITEIEKRLQEAHVVQLTRLSLSLSPHPFRFAEEALLSAVETQTSSAAFDAQNSLCLSPSGLALFASSALDGDAATWFDLKQKVVCTLVMQWRGRAMYCDELQAIIDQELWMFDMVKSLYTHDAYTLSRRQALVAIAALPAAVLAAPHSLRRDTPAPEEFLPACAASMSACWQLMNGKEIATVERELARYLPLLMTQARQCSLYQEAAAFLASQGCLLLSLVALHRCHIRGRVSYCQQAVDYARRAGNPSLLVRTLVHLGDAFHTNEQLPEMLLAYQEAALSLDQVSPRLRSHALAESAHAYALNGKVQDTLRCLGEARATFTGERDDASSFLLADTGLFSLILYEGTAYLDLGKRYEEAQDHAKARSAYTQAAAALAQIEQVSATIPIPERVRLEIINLRTLAAVKASDLEGFQHFILQGIEGAKALESEKRRQEVISTWKLARHVWPKEASVLDLVDAFL